MEHIFKYTVLQAVPDLRRGERVNIGIAVFTSEKIDIRFADTPKVRALTNENWDTYLDEAEDRFIHCWDISETPEEAIANFSLLEHAIVCTEFGELVADNIRDYELRLNEILDELVVRHRPRKKTGATRINTEITKEFRRVKILAGREESIDDHKVVRNFVVSQEEDLVADFALKNGVYHITATLDLRLARVNIGQAAIKAIVLDKAAKEFGEVRRIGVYAVDSHAPQYRSHIALLQDYADDTFNWLDSHDRMEFTRLIYDALPPLGHLQSSN